MKQLHTLNTGEAIKFNAGQAGKFLIMREASNTVMLRGDALRPVEIERGDTVDITRFDELELFNHKADAVTIEYQVADIPIITKAQKIDISNSVAISEIQAPVTVGSIQEPVKVDFPAVQAVSQSGNWSISSIPKVKFDGRQPVSVDFPDVQAVSEAKTTTNALPQITLSGSDSIAANPNRKAVIVVADKENTDTVWVGGFIPLEAGGSTQVPSWDALSVTGVMGDKLYLGEVV